MSVFLFAETRLYLFRAECVKVGLRPCVDLFYSDMFTFNDMRENSPNSGI